jgi:creatinine amidohydrolase
MIKMEDAVDTEPKGYMPPGHIDKAGNLYGEPIPWYAQVGLGSVEIAATPEGSVGKATLASAEKARPGVVALLDYMERLVDDIMKKFPPGELPPAEETTQRFSKEEVEKLMMGPLGGGKHLYTVAWPAY